MTRNDGTEHRIVVKSLDPDFIAALYRERAHLPAILAALYPAVISANDPEEPDWPVVYIETPRGQMTWHLSQTDLDLFSCPHVAGNDPRAQWDWHTTEEKYRRLQLLISDLASSGFPLQADLYEPKAMPAG